MHTSLIEGRAVQWKNGDAWETGKVLTLRNGAEYEDRGALLVRPTFSNLPVLVPEEELLDWRDRAEWER